MLQKKKKESQKNKERLNSYVKYSGIAFQMIAIILIGVFGGMKIDKWLKTEKPVFTALLSALAVILAIYYSIKDLLRTK
jgi:F0F1-type ATP synthase assembly protein I